MPLLVCSEACDKRTNNQLTEDLQFFEILQEKILAIARNYKYGNNSGLLSIVFL